MPKHFTVCFKLQYGFPNVIIHKRTPYPKNIYNNMQ